MEVRVSSCSVTSNTLARRDRHGHYKTHWTILSKLKIGTYKGTWCLWLVPAASPLKSSHEGTGREDLSPEQFTRSALKNNLQGNVAKFQTGLNSRDYSHQNMVPVQILKQKWLVHTMAFVPVTSGKNQSQELVGVWRTIPWDKVNRNGFITREFFYRERHS